MKRLFGVVAVVVVMSAQGAQTPVQAKQPVRSGAVAGGPIDTGPGTDCGWAADCVTWLASGCDPHLAGRNPAVQTSIVDVASLAGRRSVRRFVVLEGASRKAPVGVVIGGFRIQFWSEGCREVQPSTPVHDAYTDYFPQYIRNASWFKIPARAAWMTAAADDNVLIRWEMY